MKSLKIDLPRELTQMYIVAIGDVHASDPIADLKLFESRVNRVKDNDETYCLLNGDLGNLALAGSKSDFYSATMTPKQQLDYLCKILYPIKDKILFMNEGNHESRVYRNSGISFTEMLAIELGLKDRVSMTGTLCFLRFGEIVNGRKLNNDKSKYRQVCYSIYATHGGKSGGKVGSKAQALMDISNNIAADLIIKSHTHQSMILPSRHIQLDYSNNTYQEKDQLLINTGAYLSYGGYGEVKEYAPTSTVTPIIKLDGRKKKVTAFIEADM